MIMLEGAKATTETVDALRSGAAAMKGMQKAMYCLSMLKSCLALAHHFVLFLFFQNRKDVGIVAYYFN